MRVRQLWAGCVGILLAAALLGKTPALPVMAEENVYTVTFRSGDVGDFKDPAGIGEKYVSSGAAVEYEITQHKAVKLKIKAGTSLPALLQATDVKAGKDYFAKSAAEWGPEAGMTVDGNRDYVVDYGKLVDGVEYTVVFADSKSGTQIAPSATAYANVGDVITYTAPVSIISDQYGIYNLQGEAGRQMTLGTDAAANVFTYSYTNIYDPGTAVVENVVTVGGGTEEEVVTNVVFVNGAEISAARVPTGGDANAPQGDNTVIEDAETPLADDVPGSGENENVTIEDQEVPGADAPAGAISNSVAVALAAVGVAAVAVLMIWLRIRKKNAE